MVYLRVGKCKWQVHPDIAAEMSKLCETDQQAAPNEEKVAVL